MTEYLSFTNAVLAGALLSAVVGLGVLVLARLLTRRSTGTIEVIEAVAAAAAVAFVQYLMVSDGFGRLHVAYLYVFVTVPVLGAGLLAASLVVRARPQRWAVVAGAGMTGLAVVGLYATHVEPRWLRVDRAALDVEAVRGDAPIRIGVMADLQTDGIGGYERGAVDRLMAQEPDVILVAGDYFQSSGADFEESLPELRALLSRLRAPGGVFLVEGDVDSPERMAFMTEGLDLQWLDHEVTTTEVRGHTVHIGGISVHYRSDESRATIERLAGFRAADGVRILLSHRPDAAFHVPEGGADLIVSGHTHGGQVQLPVIGPPITLSNVPRHVAAGGLHRIDGTPIYLSTGVGLERATAPQVRLGVRPSIGVVTLT